MYTFRYKLVNLLVFFFHKKYTNKSIGQHYPYSQLTNYQCSLQIRVLFRLSFIPSSGAPRIWRWEPSQLRRCSQPPSSVSKHHRRSSLNSTSLYSTLQHSSPESFSYPWECSGSSRKCLWLLIITCYLVWLMVFGFDSGLGYLSIYCHDRRSLATWPELRRSSCCSS